ncbi:MAG: hypothetical protein ICV54_02220 [Nostoc sp. C3-bin3]|nr:hypothetical protein [Nostoc sp. C3-bin3]
MPQALRLRSGSRLSEAEALIFDFRLAVLAKTATFVFDFKSLWLLTFLVDDFVLVSHT